MMRAKTELKVKRWKDQRWLLDTVIQAVGMEWDQPRLNYTMYPAGPDAFGDFRAVGMRVRKFADMHREFVAAAKRREVKAANFEQQGRKVSARESYFIAALLYSAARWPIFESTRTSIGYNERMVACYDKFAALMNRPIERAEIPFGDGKTLPGYETPAQIAELMYVLTWFTGDKPTFTPIMNPAIYGEAIANAKKIVGPPQ